MMVLFVLLQGNEVCSQSRVVFVDSYHEGYEWSDGITNAILKEFSQKKIDLTIIRMDSKRHTNKEFIQKAAENAKDRILSIKPDLIIASDDNASRYLIMPYFKNSSFPVIFCGINWDASLYGYPYQNSTGMIEVADIAKLTRYLASFTKGKRVSYLAADVLTARKEGLYYKIQLDNDIKNVYVNNLEEWVNAYKKLQTECDILIIGNNTGINDWNDQKALKTVMAHTRIPTGAIYDFMTPFALIGYIKDAGEQGEWAARAALKVLDGIPVTDIPMSKNKRFSLVINRKIAQAAGLKLSESLVSEADILIE